METGRNLEHTTERHQRGFRVPMETGSICPRPPAPVLILLNLRPLPSCSRGPDHGDDLRTVHDISKHAVLRRADGGSRRGPQQPAPADRAEGPQPHGRRHQMVSWVDRSSPVVSSERLDADGSVWYWGVDRLLIRCENLIYLDIQRRPRDYQWLFLSRWKWEWVKLL